MSDLIRREDAYEVLTEYYHHHTDVQHDALREALSRVPSAELEQRWIPVTERLPKKENKSYWICTDTKHQCECRWTNNIYGIGKSNNWGWSIFDIPQYTRIIAWMPLPEVYEVSDELLG